MAQYCRYCGKKRKDRRDFFCYSCRREGAPVDYFYRFAKKVEISETEKDIIRGFRTALIEIAGTLFLFFMIPLLIVVLLVEVSTPVAVMVYVPTAILPYYVVMGIAMRHLEKRIIGRKWVIRSIMIFLATFRSNRSGIALISAAMTARKKIVRENMLYVALTHLAEGIYVSDKEPAPKPAPSEWICGFCGYLNTADRIECKSCGKTK